jgi:hypothetical protein
MHALPYTARALIFSANGDMRLERPAGTYATSAEARIACDEVLAAHRVDDVRSLVQVHDAFGGRVSACDDH